MYNLKSAHLEPAHFHLKSAHLHICTFEAIYKHDTYPGPAKILWL